MEVIRHQAVRMDLPAVPIRRHLEQPEEPLPIAVVREDRQLPYAATDEVVDAPFDLVARRPRQELPFPDPSSGQTPRRVLSVHAHVVRAGGISGYGRMCVATVPDLSLYSTSARKRRVRSCVGDEKNCSGGASSMIRPSSIIRIELATWCAKRSSCETTTIVMPSRASPSMTSSTSRTSSTSSADVG